MSSSLVPRFINGPWRGYANHSFLELRTNLNPCVNMNPCVMTDNPAAAELLVLMKLGLWHKQEVCGPMIFVVI